MTYHIFSKNIFSISSAAQPLFILNNMFSRVWKKVKESAGNVCICGGLGDFKVSYDFHQEAETTSMKKKLEKFSPI